MKLINRRNLFIFTLLKLLTNCFCETANDAANTTITGMQKSAADCRYAPGLVIGNRETAQKCCDDTVQRYEKEWGFGRFYLSIYLQSLRSWGCPQFEEECRYRVYAFTEYSRLMYEYYCNYTDFVRKCYAQVNSTRLRPKAQSYRWNTSPEKFENKTQNSSNSVEEWKLLLRRLDPALLALEQLLVPCVQVAVYDAEEEHLGSFHEIIRFHIPSCYPVWCGVGGEMLKSRSISAWACMPSSCRAKMVAIMVMCGFLSVLITVFNLSVILVYIFNPMMRHSQGIYKASLAVADLLVGVVVFPTFISSLARITLSRNEGGDVVDVRGYEFVNGSLGENLTIVQVRNPGGQFSDFFDRAYLDAVGFFTVLSFTVSIYNLTVAGFDRLSAVYRPLSYNKDRAKRLAKIFCAVLWCIGFIFAILPVMVSTLRYSLVASIMVSSAGREALIVYVVAFAIPILIMWTVNAITFHSTRKHARVRRHLTVDSKKKSQSLEVRLARTLAIMAGVFTLSIVPAAVAILASLFIPSIYLTNPRGLDLPTFVAYGAIEFAAIVILACNSLWNFLIYNARNLEFRKASKIMYKKLSEALGLSKCFDAIVRCAQSVAHDGRRRISSIPTISTTFGKKASLTPTSQTALHSTRKSSDVTMTEETFRKKSSITNESSSRVEESRATPSSSAIVSPFISSEKPKYKKNERKMEQSMDDSIFQSFAIDANADRLYLSVMERIDEDHVKDEKK